MADKQTEFGDGNYTPDSSSVNISSPFFAPMEADPNVFGGAAETTAKLGTKEWYTQAEEAGKGLLNQQLFQQEAERYATGELIRMKELAGLKPPEKAKKYKGFKPMFRPASEVLEAVGVINPASPSLAASLAIAKILERRDWNY